ncbi:MAG: ATP-binding protein [Anaerolineae bacterium]|nr:ATP-binding protein [Anaerolineae bacterium]
MLTKLRFQNWRSLQDVTIENLTPLTVLIGANSSGKTNVIDGLYFLREANTTTLLQSVESRGGLEKIHTLGVNLDDPLEIAITYQHGANIPEIEYSIALTPSSKTIVQSHEVLHHGTRTFEMSSKHNSVQVVDRADRDFVVLPTRVDLDKTLLGTYGGLDTAIELSEIYSFIADRWQMLAENFGPSISVPSRYSGNPRLINRDADNLPFILHFMLRYDPDTYRRLLADVQLLVGHIEKLSVQANDRETRFYIQERNQLHGEAPTISAGTARLVAMLTAYYALDIGPRASMPGLVVIEEPDTALNPWILRDFVGFLRRAVEGEYPRQFILTTHNPALLDYFEPDEVRLVTRDEQGISHVQAIPEQLKTIWEDPIALGEVWMTNAFGDMPL